MSRPTCVLIIIAYMAHGSPDVTMSYAPLTTSSAPSRALSNAISQRLGMCPDRTESADIEISNSRQCYLVAQLNPPLMQLTCFSCGQGPGPPGRRPYTVEPGCGSERSTEIPHSCSGPAWGERVCLPKTLFNMQMSLAVYPGREP